MSGLRPIWGTKSCSDVSSFCSSQTLFRAFALLAALHISRRSLWKATPQRQYWENRCSSFSFWMSPCTYILLSSLAILNYLNLLKFRSCHGLVTYLVRGKLQECEGFAIIARSSRNQRMAYFNILFNYLKKIVTINTTSLAIIVWILY